MLKEPPPHDCDLWVTVIDRDFDTDWELAEHQLYLIIDIFLVLSQDSCVIFCKIHLFKYLNPEKAHCSLFSQSPVKVNPIWLNIVKHSGGWLPFLRTRIRARSHFRNLPGINPGASTAALVLKSDHFLLRIRVLYSHSRPSGVSGPNMKLHLEEGDLALTILRLLLWFWKPKF